MKPRPLEVPSNLPPNKEPNGMLMQWARRIVLMSKIYPLATSEKKDGCRRLGDAGTPWMRP